MSNITKSTYLDDIVETIKSIDTKNLSDDIDNSPLSKVIEEQKVYFWIRLFLKEEDPNINIGDDIVIEWVPTGEKLETKFIAWGKKGFDKDGEDEITSYSSEDDKKVLSLMIDTKMVNFNDNIPFIRTLFKTGYHYQDTIFRRSELLFVNKRNGMILDYFDSDF
jgi:hypothetical protein